MIHSDSEPDESCSFTFSNQPDGTVLLKADNGNYVCRMTSQGWSFRPHEAIKQTANDTCKFTVHDLSDGIVALQSDNGLYVSRVGRGSYDYMEVDKCRLFRLFISDCD